MLAQLATPIFELKREADVNRVMAAQLKAV